MPAKKAKGRPALPPAERRDILIRVLVNKREYEELQDEAETVGTSLSTSMRLAALAAVRARRERK
jgi:hypothetical protein